MQIAGGQCEVCGRHVGVMRDGAGCEACKIVVHKACVEDGNCPKCGRRFLPTEEVHSRPSASLQTDLDRPSSVTVLARLTFVGVPIGALIAVGGLAQIATDASNGIATMFGGLLTVGFCAAMGSGFLKGQDWARRFYLWGTPLIMATNSVFGSNRLFRPGFSVWQFVLQVVMYCVWFFFLMRPNARVFFQRRQAMNG
jgi:hypothetical protein